MNLPSFVLPMRVQSSVSLATSSPAVLIHFLNRFRRLVVVSLVGVCKVVP